MSVVVGYVPDPTGSLAVAQAAREALWRRTDLVVVNVVGPAGYQEPTSAGEQDLDALGLRIAEQGVSFTIRHSALAPGDHASDEILKAAEQTGAELIVVGLRRRSSVAKALLGSNAQRVLLDATCPVLSVRADG